MIENKNQLINDYQTDKRCDFNFKKHIENKVRGDGITATLREIIMKTPQS